ncbi:sphingosine kinase 2 isoform X2 [Agrilus planipennis]|uniref:Sphingosine kinase 2 isoform X2 n=1 Tax=Agrilus planipennis TaxID=224129 RepID=A0A1W4XL17_AGRPL|nr:sphingosine kinase 2 isoform X2 [Agrilus planipennis]
MLTVTFSVGGDGILFEVLNGVFERPDWLEVLNRIVFAIIPSGSGNGLARTIAHQFSEPYHPHPTLAATLALVKRHVEPMDIVRVETRSKIMFSFLSAGWGLLSDIDIESESLRMLGGQRFTLWSLARLIGLRSYTGKVSYLPLDERQQQQLPKMSTKTSVDPANVDFPDEVLLETAEMRTRLGSWYSAASRRSAYFSMVGSVYQSTTGSNNEEDEENGTKTPLVYGPGSQVAALTAPVPDNWVCLEGQFVMVHASYQSHLGEDCLFAPRSKLNDGIIWLLIVHAKATRSQLLHFLLGLSTGAHATSKDASGSIELVPCLAFRIEPDVSEQGYITVDGEHVEYGPIQAEIFAGLSRILVP